MSANVEMGHQRIVVTGAGGRVGTALVALLRHSGVHPLEWRRPDYDLDDPTSAFRLMRRDRPSLVFHLAAWTDVDACARQPDTAQRRNSAATVEIAQECVRVGARLIFVSTNEVFSGRRTDGRGYRESDPAEPVNAYGGSKLSAELGAAEAFASSGPDGLWIVRTSWIFGPPGNDFPSKILAHADTLPPGEPLAVVADEFGRPTAAGDLAVALVRLSVANTGGTLHIAGGGEVASRFEWAAYVVNRCQPTRRLTQTNLAGFPRSSTPPPWGVLDTSLAASLGILMRPWQESTEDYLGRICPD